MDIKNKESDAIYIMRAIGIMTVVIGHHWGILVGITKPYLYHMPLFFFLGGIFINGENPMKKSISASYKILRYLILTYIIIGSFSILISSKFKSNLGNPFGDGIVDTITLIFSNNFHNNELFLVGWFLFTYLISFIIVNFIINLSSKTSSEVKKTTFLLITGIILGIISVNLFSMLYKKTSLQIYNLLSQIFYASMFMIFGNLFWKKFIYIKNYILLLMIASIVIITYYSGISKAIIMSWSNYPSGFFISTVIAIMCIILISFLASFLSKSRANKILINIGKESREIMSYHLVCFVIIDLIFYSIGLWDMSKTTSMIHYKSFLSQFIYISLGVIIPVTFVFIIKKLKF